MKRILVLLFVISGFRNLAFSQFRPNIIFIFSDDHDADAISAYNKKLIQTPGFDRLAREGMLFRKNFVANSICAPARATILTGKHSHMNHHKDNQTSFDTSQYTFTKQLQKAGYQTALIGKWHLKTLPSGFDFWTVLPDQGQYFTPSFINMAGDTISSPGSYATSLITNKSTEWLEKRDRSRPFLLMMQHKAPHRNWWPELKYAQKYFKTQIPEPNSLYADTAGRGKAFRDQRMRILEDMSLCADLKVDPESLLDIPHLKPTESEIKYYQSLYSQVPESERNEFKKLFAQRGETLKRLKPTGKDLLRLKYQWYLQDYLACVASVDESVNQLLDYLKRNGLNENTVVVYTSDQGFYLGENGWFDKRFMYDVSMQSPLLVRWTGKIKPGSVSDALVQNIDMAPTFLDLAGEKIPSEIQGLSIKAILLGSQQKLNRTALYYHYYEFPIDHHVYPHLGIRTDRYKLIYFYTVNEWELYDLIRDPSERNNKIKDPGYRKIAQQLNQQLKELRRYYHDDEPAGEL